MTHFVLLRGIVGGNVFVGKLHLMRIGAAHAVCVGPVDMSRDPFPPLCLLNLGGNPFQLFQHKPVQPRGVLIKAATILGEQVADDVAARFGIGFRADEYRAPIRSRHIAGGQVAADDPRFLVVGQVLKDVFLPGVVVGDGKRLQLAMVSPPSR